MQTSARWSPSKAGQSSSPGEIASRSQIQRPAMRVFTGRLAGKAEGRSAPTDRLVEGCSRALIEIEEDRHLLAGGMQAAGFDIEQIVSEIGLLFPKPDTHRWPKPYSTRR